MTKEDVLDALMLSIFAAPILVAIISLLFKKWREKMIHYLLITLAVLLVVMWTPIYDCAYNHAEAPPRGWNL